MTYSIHDTRIVSLSDFVAQLSDLHSRLNEDGTLDQVVAMLDPRTEMRVMTLCYMSRDEQNLPIEMSALLVIPILGGKIAAHRLIVENRATQAADRSVPTHTWNIGTAHALTGSVLLSADLMGFGASVDRPICYIHSQLAARNTIDAILAAQQMMIDTGLIASPLSIINTGHSQGGYDALAVHRYWETEATAEERRLLPLQQSFCASGPYATDEQMEIISRREKYLYGAYMVMNAMSHLHYHHECFDADVTIDDFLTDAARKTGIVERIETKSSGNSALVKDLIAELGLKTSALFREDVYLPEGRIYRMMLAASAKDRLIGGWQPTRPIHFYHATYDECVPVECMYAAQREWEGNPLVTFAQDEWHEEPMVHRYSGGAFHRWILRTCARDIS